MIELMREICASGIIMQPSENDLANPEIRQYLDRYMRGKSVDVEQCHDCSHPDPSSHAAREGRGLNLHLADLQRRLDVSVVGNVGHNRFGMRTERGLKCLH